MSGTTTPATSNASMLAKWDPSKACSPNFYYDEPAGSALPPDFLDMTDFWVVEVCRANVKAQDKARRWPSVFSSKWLADTYQTKGPAAKHVGADGQWCYTVVFNRFQMHGQEGLGKNLTRKIPNRMPYSNNDLDDGAHCDAPPADAPFVTETKKAGGKAHRKSTRIAGQQSTKAKSSDAKSNASTTKTPDVKQTRKRRDDTSSASASKRQKTSTPIKQQNVTYTIIDLSESENDGELKALREENKTLKDKAKAVTTMEEKLKASDAKFTLLAETTASIHAAIDPLINRVFVGTSLLKKAYSSMADDDLKEEVREFYKGHTSAIGGIVNESQGKVVNFLKSHAELVMLFDHSDESKARLQNLVASNVSTTAAAATDTPSKIKPSNVSTTAAAATNTPSKKKTTRKGSKSRKTHKKTMTPHVPPAALKDNAAASPPADVKAEITDDKADETTDVKVTGVKQSIFGGDDGAAVEDEGVEDHGAAAEEEEDEGDEEDEDEEDEDEDEAGKEDGEVTDDDAVR